MYAAGALVTQSVCRAARFVGNIETNTAYWRKNGPAESVCRRRHVVCRVHPFCDAQQNGLVQIMDPENRNASLREEVSMSPRSPLKPGSTTP